MLLEKTINGVRYTFDTDLYMKIRKIRGLINPIVSDARFNFKYHEGNYPINHPLLYKIISKKKTGKLYIVTKILKQYCAGWCIMARIDTADNDSGMILIENISSLEFNENEPILTDQFDITNKTMTEFFNNYNADWFNDLKAKNDDLIKQFEILHNKS